MILQYRCSGCSGQDWIDFEVPDRTSQQDIRAWMETMVRPALGAHHTRRNPFCISGECDLKIPIPDGTKAIGAPVQN